MEEIKKEQLMSLHEIFDEHIKRTGNSDRTNVAYVCSSIFMAIQDGTGKFWVDDIDNPTHYVYASVARRSILNEVAGLIEAIYIKDDTPDKLSKLREMVSLSEAFFKHNKCSVSSISSWVANGSRDIVKIWERLGYAQQEIITTKFL